MLLVVGCGVPVVSESEESGPKARPARPWTVEPLISELCLSSGKYCCLFVLRSMPNSIFVCNQFRTPYLYEQNSLLQF
jgi:hypothetical protein